MNELGASPFFLSLMTTSLRLACIAHKCLDISERRRLWQQDIPATPEHPAAVFWKKVLNKLFNKHRRRAVHRTRKRLMYSYLARDERVAPD
jgi:hypothetical protein